MVDGRENGCPRSVSAGLPCRCGGAPLRECSLPLLLDIAVGSLCGTGSLIGGLVPASQLIAATEPGIVNIYLENETSRYRETGYRYMHDMLNEHGPAHALAREWAGAYRITGELRADNQRPRKLLHDVARTLRSHGHERDAQKLERHLQGR